MFEFQGNGRSGGLGLVGIGAAHHASHAAHAYVVVPLAFPLRAAVDLQVEALFFEYNIGDLHAVAHFAGSSIGHCQLMEARFSGHDLALGRERNGLVANGKHLAHPHKLGIQNRDDLHARGLADRLPFLQLCHRYLLLLKIWLGLFGGRSDLSIRGQLLR